MPSLLAHFLMSRYFIALFEALFVPPMVLGAWESILPLWRDPDLHLPMETVTGIGVIMIGIGVVLEERHALREMFGIVGQPDEAWQETIDHSCHHAGVAQLVLGLFTEISIELIRIPNTVIYTGDADDWLVAMGCFFITCGAFLQLRHAIKLVLMSRRGSAPGWVPAPGPVDGPGR